MDLGSRAGIAANPNMTKKWPVVTAMGRIHSPAVVAIPAAAVRCRAVHSPGRCGQL
jgi:hypothetical protein